MSDTPELIDVRCASCSMKFWLEPEFLEHSKRMERTIYCPNGHGNVWIKPKDQNEIVIDKTTSG